MIIKQETKNILLWAIISLLLMTTSVMFAALKKSSRDIKGLNQRVNELKAENKNKEKLALQGWGPYMNEKYGFIIWYPKEGTNKLSIAENDEIPWYAQNANLMQKFAFIPTISEPNNGIPAKPYFTVIIYDKYVADMEEFAREELIQSGAPLADGKIEQTNLANHIAYKYTTDSYSKYYIQKNNLIYVLNFDARSSALEEINSRKTISEQMARTFEFVE